MQHLSNEWHAEGLTPYQVQFCLKESSPLPSMLDEGFIYQRPQRHEDAVVWARSELSIPEVLRYHFGNEWYDVRVVRVIPELT
jgi:hypothetical protein